MTREELIELYGIEIDENTNEVFDPIENKRFESIEKWADYLDEIEADNNYSKFTKIGGRQPFDDEY